MTMPEFELEVYSDPAHYITFDLNGAGRTLAAFGLTLGGWSVRNMSASTLATFDLYDGTDTSGTILFPVTLAANESSREWFYPGGIQLKNGLYMNVTAQEVKGAVFYRRHR